VTISITDQMKSKDYKSILSVLKTAKSKILKKWKELDIRVTDAANEAKVRSISSR
jgi:dynein heavy chain